MKNETTPSDEEIRSYMNFDTLLEKRKIVSEQNRFHVILKWGVAIFMITGVVTWLVITSNTNTRTNENEITPLLEKPSPKRAMQSIQVDSIGRDPEANQPNTGKVREDDQLTISKQTEAEKKTGIDKSVEKSAPEDLYVQAEPIEGYTKLYDYFAENLIYPAEALSDSIQGVQTISFIVSANGKPENITISHSLGLPFEKEARRLIGNMPLWKPATLNGKPVPSKVAVPLTFQIKRISK